MTNQERINKGLELLRAGLEPFVRRHLEARFGDSWQDEARSTLSGGGAGWRERGGLSLDVAALLTLLDKYWHDLFKQTLGQTERSYVYELRDVRNKWAHQDVRGFSGDDVYRAFDTMGRLLTAISAPQAKEFEAYKQELLRVRFEEQSRNERRKSAEQGVSETVAAGTRPWRELITPHEDVATGQFTQAEFAADLSAVYDPSRQTSQEYSDPKKFFERTFLTQGLRYLFKQALLRVNNRGGDPIIELQTNFGGGKTHAMLGLYHLFSGQPATALLGIEEILRDNGIEKIPAKVSRVVLVGTALSPGQPNVHDDGSSANTLWGELAWQLGGAQGYAMVAESDQRGTNPGSNILRDLLARYAPCLILVDEWVTHLRQLYLDATYPAGSFDANLSFAQSLTEAVKLVTGALLVVSLPASDNEIGGDGGRAALDRLRNIFGRVESAWRPASTEEGFEIVRRRLFQPISEKEHFIGRDNSIKQFIKLYKEQKSEFPATCNEGNYETRMQLAYPIHPELFDRLYDDWSTLDKFQRTRGVLRLMASIIHHLWENNDQSALIMPCHVPLGAATSVQGDLLRYLDDNWLPVLEKDVDALARQLDKEKPNLGRYHACRRVARTIFIGSAPTSKSRNVGLDERNVKLGSVQPGEQIGTFGDALRSLTDRATHLYADRGRYWFSTQPSVLRLAQDRAQNLEIEEVWKWLRDRLRGERERGDFVAVHTWPEDSSLVVDEESVRLVILGPLTAHKRNDKTSLAMEEARKLLGWRGSTPRLNQNMVVFLSADQQLLPNLEKAIRTYLAWDSLYNEGEQLNLTNHQQTQIKTNWESAKKSAEERLRETYRFLLSPHQQDGLSPHTLELEELLLNNGEGSLAQRASRRLRDDEQLIVTLAGSRLRMALDDYHLWTENGGDHVNLKTLWGYFARYPYLPRLRDVEVLLKAVASGVAGKAEDTFGYAERWDKESEVYRVVSAEKAITPLLDGHTVLLHPRVILALRKEAEEEEARRRSAEAETILRETPTLTGTASTLHVASGAITTPVTPTAETRFFATVEVDGLRANRDLGQILEAIVPHLLSEKGAKVQVAIEIHAQLPKGVSDQVKRVVEENAKTLKLKIAQFE